MTDAALRAMPAITPGTIDLPRNDAATGESLIALTLDDSLKETLAVAAPEHSLTFVTGTEELSQHLCVEPAGVAILDSAALNVPLAELTKRLRAQFPDLVLIVAGGPEDQSVLSAQIAQGTVYRFLHKPVSAQRVKLFVHSAWRRHDVEHSTTGTFAALKLKPPANDPMVSRSTLWIGAGALALILSGALAIALHQALSSHGATASSKTAAARVATAAAGGPTVPELLARADSALARGALSPPPVENAADLYREVLKRDASNAHARDGLERVADGLLTRAEQALLAEDIDQAAQLTDAARAIEPGNVRVTFLAAQIEKDRARGLEAVSGAGGRSRTLGGLSGTAEASRAPSAAKAPGEAEPLDLQSQVRSFLQRAQARAQSGELLAPAGNNAKFFVDAAAALAPRDPAVHAAQRDLALRMLAQARAAAQAGNLSEGERWARAATDAGAPSEELAAVQRSLDSLSTSAQLSATDRILALFDERLAQGRFMSPANDSAGYYLAQLEAVAPTRPSTVLARAALASRLLDEARRATADQNFGAAQQWLAQARTAGASEADTAAMERTLAVARDLAAIPPESTLEKVHNVLPLYPPVAEQLGKGGFVEMQFTVRTDGTVTGISVTHSQPAGLFDAAAIDAVRQWRYRPAQRGGHPIDQRVSLRITFKP